MSRESKRKFGAKERMWNIGYMPKKSDPRYYYYYCKHCTAKFSIMKEGPTQFKVRNMSVNHYHKCGCALDSCRKCPGSKSSPTEKVVDFRKERKPKIFKG